MDYQLKIKEIREDMGTLSENMQGIVDTAEEDGRDMTDEEVKEFDSLEVKYDAKQKQLARYEKLAKQKDFADTPPSDVKNLIEQDEPEIEVGKKRGDSWKLRVVRYFNALALGVDDRQRSFEKVQKLKRKYADLSKRQLADEEKEAEKIINRSDLSNDKKEAIEQILGVNKRLMTTSTTDTAQTGNLLPKPFLARVFMLIEQYGVARRTFMQIPMMSKDIDLKNLGSSVVAYWTDEGANIQASELSIDPGKLEAKKLAGLTKWTNELAEDQAIALLPVVRAKFAESMAKKEDNAAFLGDGTDSTGGFTGLANLSNAYHETLTGTSADSITEANIRAMKSNLSTASRMNARWFMEYSTLDYISQLENSAGYRLFPNSFSDSQPGSILSDPIELVDVMPKIGDVAADSPFLIYGNPQRALMGQRRGMTADISREAVVQDESGTIVYNAYQADGALLRLTQRIGFKVPAAFEKSFAVAKTAAT